MVRTFFVIVLIFVSMVAFPQKKATKAYAVDLEKLTTAELDNNVGNYLIASSNNKEGILVWNTD